MDIYVCRIGLEFLVGSIMHSLKGTFFNSFMSTKCIDPSA